jgi:hypothetical protein
VSASISSRPRAIGRHPDEVVDGRQAQSERSQVGGPQNPWYAGPVPPITLATDRQR